MDIRNNPGKYRLWKNNYNQVTWQILTEIGKDFADTNFDWLDIRPNAAYNDIENEVNEQNPDYEGRMYGDLDEFRFEDGKIVYMHI